MTGVLVEAANLTILMMSRRASDHIEHIWALVPDHLCGVRVVLFNAKGLSRLLRLGLFHIANCDAVDVGEFLPGRNLKTGPKTTTNNGDP